MWKETYNEYVENTGLKTVIDRYKEYRCILKITRFPPFLKRFFKGFQKAES